MLLDTSTFLWWIAGDSRLPKPVKDHLLDPSSEVFLSSVSTWEIVVKNDLGKLPLPAPAASYVATQRSRHRIESLPLTESAVVHLQKLPPLHRDPFDRMLICQCLEHGLRLVTSDAQIAAYPVPILWISA